MADEKQLYLVESFEWRVLHDGAMSEGVAGQGGGSESIYLHVIAVEAAEIARLVPREDEFGNRQHDRLALPRNEEWWIAIEGDKVWPKTYRPKLVSRCAIDERGLPCPVPLDLAGQEALTALGVKLPSV